MPERGREEGSAMQSPGVASKGVWAPQGSMLCEALKPGLCPAVLQEECGFHAALRRRERNGGSCQLGPVSTELVRL